MCGLSICVSPEPSPLPGEASAFRSTPGSKTTFCLERHRHGWDLCTTMKGNRRRPYPFCLPISWINSE